MRKKSDFTIVERAIIAVLVLCSAEASERQKQAGKRIINCCSVDTIRSYNT